MARVAFAEDDSRETLFVVMGADLRCAACPESSSLALLGPAPILFGDGRGTCVTGSNTQTARTRLCKDAARLACRRALARVLVLPCLQTTPNKKLRARCSDEAVSIRWFVCFAATHVGCWICGSSSCVGDLRCVPRASPVVCDRPVYHVREFDTRRRIIVTLTNSLLLHN